MAQSKRINRIFELKGKFYAFDSTTIDLCLSIFWWTAFRKTQGGIKVHTLFDIVTQIPTFFHITAANVHDVKAMDEIPYEQHAYYIFDKGYYDWARMYNISTLQAYFIIREKNNIQYEIINGDEVLDGKGIHFAWRTDGEPTVSRRSTDGQPTVNRQSRLTSSLCQATFAPKNG